MTEFITFEQIVYVLVVLLVVVIGVIIWNILLQSRIKKLMRGRSGQSLEDSFLGMQNEINELKVSRSEIEKYLKIVEKRLSKSITGFHNVSFNAFQGLESGGKSFATAFLNENGDGVIISSLHARDRINIFSKEIKGYQSEIELSKEEQTALTKAKESCSL